MSEMSTIVLNMTNAATEHVLRTGKTITYLNIRSRDWVRFGHKHEGKADPGHNVSVTPGQSVRLFGLDDNKVGGPVRYDLTFKIGDLCERDSYNLVYVGRIVAIGAKTVTIAHQHSNRKTRMSLDEFSRRNRDFDLQAINKRNSEWMD